MSTHAIATSAGDMAYDDVGSGAPVVLLHATLHDRRDFAPIVPALARHHRVIAVDWPGHGESPTRQPVTVDLLATALGELVTALGLPPAVLVGNSVGGYAAARLAIEQPDRVAGLVLVNSGGFLPRNVFVRTFCAVMGRPWINRRVMPRFVRGYMKAATANDEAIVARTTAAARTPAGTATAASLWRSFNDDIHDLRGRAHGIVAPTLVVWGTRDIAIPARVGRLTHAAIAGSTLLELNTGHVVFSSAPDEFMAAMERFLRSTAVRNDRGTVN